MADSYETAMANAVEACSQSAKAAAASANTAASRANAAKTSETNAKNSATTAAEKAALVPYVAPDAKQALKSTRSLLGIDITDLETAIV